MKQEGHRLCFFSFSLSASVSGSLYLCVPLCVCERECAFRAAGVVRRMLSLTFEASDRASERRGETDPDTDKRRPPGS